MIEKFIPQQEKHTFPEVTLFKGGFDKGYGVEFSADDCTKEIVMIYNKCISDMLDEVFPEKHKSIYHQAGNGNEPGYHMWEILFDKDPETKRKIEGSLGRLNERIQNEIEKTA